MLKTLSILSFLISSFPAFARETPYLMWKDSKGIHRAACDEAPFTIENCTIGKSSETWTDALADLKNQLDYENRFIKWQITGIEKRKADIAKRIDGLKMELGEKNKYVDEDVQKNIKENAEKTLQKALAEQKDFITESKSFLQTLESRIKSNESLSTENIEKEISPLLIKPVAYKRSKENSHWIGLLDLTLGTRAYPDSFVDFSGRRWFLLGFSSIDVMSNDDCRERFPDSKLPKMIASGFAANTGIFDGLKINQPFWVNEIIPAKDAFAEVFGIQTFMQGPLSMGGRGLIFSKRDMRGAIVCEQAPPRSISYRTTKLIRPFYLLTTDPALRETYSYTHKLGLD
jgi:hypothetical protein